MRIAAALVLAPIALAAAWFGGTLWLVLALAVAIGLYTEWLMIVGGPDVTWRMPVVIAGAVLLAGVAACLWLQYPAFALLTALGGALAAAVLSPAPQRFWNASGFLYAASALIASIVLRSDAVSGFAAVVFVLGVVWATDIMGYVAGRSLGGPKLWPRVSPKKTWSGAVGSLLGSLAVGAAFASAGFGAMKPMLMLSLVLSVVSQLGDLFESAVKRRFGVKDSSHIIPGHGGLLDRLDGFVAAAVAATLIGVSRGGFPGAAQGLLNW